MDQLGKLIESLTKPRHEEDSIDRLNYHLTTIILLAAAFTIIAKEYGGDPIQCWLPAQLASQRSWEQYAEDYCFIENTYYIPLEQNLPQSEEHRNNKMITYYQWVPFTLMLQAMLFVVPHVFWRMLNWTANVQTRAVISMGSSARQMDPCSNEAKEMLDAIANHMYHANRAKPLRKTLQNTNPLIILSRIFAKSYLTTLYIITKLLFIANASLQFWIVSLYLGGNGYDLTKALIEQRTWQNTGLFPRVTMCDFKIRVLGNIHHHTIQCVLMANMFNEKIYIGLWWWLLIVITLTATNLVYWLYVLTSANSNGAFLLRLIRLRRQLKDDMERYQIETFTEQFAGDAALVLRLLAQNAGELVASGVAARLFDTFKNDNIIPEKQRYEELDGVNYKPPPPFNDIQRKDNGFAST